MMPFRSSTDTSILGTMITWCAVTVNYFGDFVYDWLPWLLAVVASGLTIWKTAIDIRIKRRQSKKD